MLRPIAAIVCLDAIDLDGDKRVGFLPLSSALMAIAVAACGATAPSPATIGSPSPMSVGGSPSPAISLASLAPEGFPHQEPGLEATLPNAVAGRPLTIWSVRGKDAYAPDGTQLDEDALRTVQAELAGIGLTLDDVSSATAGRSSLADPPSLVVVWRFKGVPADELGPIGIAYPDAGAFESITIADKEVQRGTAAMMAQTEPDHLRGIPYIYNVGDLHFTVVADDETWAADAIRQLPSEAP